MTDHDQDTVVRSRPTTPINKGPVDWFTGAVWIDALVQPEGRAHLNVGAVHFTPGARTAWHSHDGDQIL